MAGSAIRWSLVFACVLAGAAAQAAPVLKGPPPREITDPASIVSASLPGAAPVPVADLFYTRGGMDAVWAPDGRTLVISTNLTGRYNLWKLSSDGGFPLQLTQSDERQTGIVVSPDGHRVVFESDRGGGEIWDLYATPLDGGPVVDLTDTPDVSETGAIFSPDGAALAFDRRPAKASATDIAVMDLATHKVRLLTHEASPDHSWSLVAYTADGRSLIANRSDFGGKESAVWRIDLESGRAEPVSRNTPGAFDAASAVSPDGRLIAVTTEVASGARQAAVLDTASHALRLVAPDPWEQRSGDFSPDGKALVFQANVDGREDLRLFDLASGKSRALDLPAGLNSEAGGNITSFSPDGRRLLISHQASNAPFDYWTIDLASGRAAPATRLGLASIDPARLPAARIVHYRSEDGTVVSALMWTPFNLARDGSAPGVVLPHGGPTGQTVDSFNRTAIALASRGYVVIAPNPRGSTGYGRAFQEANHKDLGGGDLVDEVYGAKFLVATGYVDAKKIGITGGSYGGYMTLMAIGKTPDVWAAAVEQYGIINWFAMYAHEAPTLQQYQIGLIGDPVKDKAVYEASSPLTYIRHAKAPLLVLQGDNDIRVPKGQAVEVVEILKGIGAVVDAHYYPNEGHGFVKRENQIDALERTVAWFDKYLKGGK